MELRISINEKAVFALLIVVAMASAVGITLAAPPDPGHTWGEIECPGCITSADVNFNYAGSDSKGGKATSAATADSATTATTAATAGSAGSVPWDGIANRPSGLDDGDDYTACSWTDWRAAYPGVSCTGGYPAGYITTLEFECIGGKITSSRTKSVPTYCES